MKYLVLKIEGEEVPVIVGASFDLSAVEWPGKIVAGGELKIQQMIVTCEGTQKIGDREIVSRGMTDEVLIQHYDYIKAIP